MPEPEPPRKIRPSRVFQSRIESMLSSTREDEAGRALRLLLEADVEPHRRVERRELVEQDVGQLRLERVAVLDGGEVAALATPVGDRARDAADHLLDRALARRRVQLPAEVLLGDDVGRVLRPGLGELDVLLLEGDAVAVTDPRVADLPLDLVERVHAGLREQAPHGQRLTGLARCGVRWSSAASAPWCCLLVVPPLRRLERLCCGDGMLRLGSDGTGAGGRLPAPSAT